MRQDFVLKGADWNKLKEENTPQPVELTEITDLPGEKITFYDEIPTVLVNLSKKQTRNEESTVSNSEQTEKKKSEESLLKGEIKRNFTKLKLDKPSEQSFGSLTKIFGEKTEPLNKAIVGFMTGLEAEMEKMSQLEKRMNLTPKIEKLKSLKFRVDGDSERKKVLNKEISNKMRKVNYLKAKLEKNSKDLSRFEEEFDYEKKKKTLLKAMNKVKEESTKNSLEIALMSSKLIELRQTKGEEAEIEVEFDDVL